MVTANAGSPSGPGPKPTSTGRPFDAIIASSKASQVPTVVEPADTMVRPGMRSAIDASNMVSSGASSCGSDASWLLAAGAMPIIRMFIRSSYAGSTSNRSGVSRPGRSTSMLSGRSGTLIADSIITSENVMMSESPIRVIRSPGRIPGATPSVSEGATAAGESGWTGPTTGASNRTPTMNATTNITIAVRRFITTPALTTTIRLPTLTLV